MPQFRVVTEIMVEAENAKEAAMKVFALHDTIAPEDYEVHEKRGEGAWTYTNVLLEHEDKDEARRAYAAGEYFEEVDISELPKLKPIAGRSNKEIDDEINQHLRERGFKLPDDQ